MNKYKPHLLVLPEDQANNDILNGFLLHDALDSRAIQPLPLGGGWPNVRRKFISEYAETMRNHPNRHVVLLVDFDKHDDRYAKMMEGVPDDVADRVFVIGVWSEPEDLPRQELGTREELGLKLAQDCFDNSRLVWDTSFFLTTLRS